MTLTEYHMQGGGTMLVSELLEKLQIRHDPPEITEAVFTDPTLVTAEPEDGDFRLTSLQPFTSSELLTITFADGEVIEIQVEDAKGNGWFAGGDLYWEVTNDNKLIIRPKDTLGGASGTGTLNKTGGAQFETANNWPWNYLRNQISAVEIQGTINVGDGIKLNYMFAEMPSLTKVTGLEKLNTCNATGMKGMFQNCSRLTELDLSSFTNNGQVYEMQDMFSGCSSLESVTLNNPGFKTRPATDSGGGVQMNRMFEGCTSLKRVDFSNITVCGRATEDYYVDSSWKQFNELFRGNTSLKTVKLNNTKTPGMKSMESMFEGCTALTEIDLTDFKPADTRYMTNMFANCSSLTSLDVSGFGTLDNIINMDGFVQNCTSLQTLNISNLDNSNIGPTNWCHSITEGEDNVREIGAAEYGRELGIETCDSLSELIANNSNVWMCKNNRGLPGNEYDNATNESNLSFFTRYQMEYVPDSGSTQQINDLRAYTELLIDYPSFSKAGHLPAGVYHLTAVPWSEPSVPTSDTTYVITGMEHTEPVIEIVQGNNKLVYARNGSVQYVNTISQTFSVWGSGSYSIPCEVTLTYPGVVEDQYGGKHDLVITINEITFKDVGNVPSGYNYNWRYDEGNSVAYDEYYRTVLLAPSNGLLEFRNYARTGNPYEPWYSTQVLSEGSGTYIDFTVKIDGAQPGETFLFVGLDLDVAKAQEWDNTNLDACYDRLETVTYGYGSEGFELGAGNASDSIKFAGHTGLSQVGNWVGPVGDSVYSKYSTQSDPNTYFSSFNVKSSATGANYTWTSGVGCTTYILPNTYNDFEPPWQDELPSAGGPGLPVILWLGLASLALLPAVWRVKRRWGVVGE